MVLYYLLFRSTKGDYLAAVSWDGTIAFVQFHQKDTFDFPILNDQKLNLIHKQLYGKSLHDSQNNNEDIIDDIDFYKSHISTKTPSINITNTTLNEFNNQNSKPTENLNVNISIEEIKFNDECVTTNSIVPKQTETITTDGKRRIQPILIATTIDEDESDILKSTSKLEKDLKKINISPNPKKRTQSCKNILSKKLKKETEEFCEHETTHNPLLTENKKVVMESIVENLIKIDTEFSNIKISITASNIPFCKDPDLYRLDVEIINLYQWAVVLTDPISHLVTSDSLICFSTTDMKLHVYSIHGVKLLPPIISTHPLAGIKCYSDKYVLIITIYGSISVFNVPEASNVIYELETYHLLKGLIFLYQIGMTIDSYKVLENGIPFIVTSDLNSYVYNIKLRTWLSAISRECLLSNISNSRISGCRTSCISNIQALLNQRNENLKGIHRLNSSLQSLCYQSFLENALYSSLYLGSKQEFLILLKMFIRQLCLLGRVKICFNRFHW
ncbi:hypothetical protein HZS_7711 [Henneguya salminicola]|nr:hypothetical protein HZS_7711 [Henneguya salminicola]